MSREPDAPVEEDQGPTLEEAARAYLAADLELDRIQTAYQERCDALRREMGLDAAIAARGAAMQQLGRLMPQDAVVHIGDWCLNRSDFEIRVDRIITMEVQR